MKHPQPENRATADIASRKKPSRPQNKDRMAALSPPAHAEDQRTGMIRQTAYALYLARGCVAGDALDDWLRAEAQVRGLLANGESPAPASACGSPVAGA